MDALDRLAGIQPGSPLDTIRRRKPVTRDNAQTSYDALLAPDDLTEMSAAERAAVAYFVAGLHQDVSALAFYRERVSDPAPLDTEIARAAGTGPYGHFPPGPLSVEDEPGPDYTPQAIADPRLSAALAHTHMLVLHPRDAAPAHMRALDAAGWSATGIVTLSQLVSFLSFQLRAAAGLRALDRNRA